ncbi:hypothetical protein ACIG63_27320 [Streptomyces antimycoticus]|jgi:hypothetical protein|uniref:hypothetical protein n=1 Tax=Streptomyces antimycoticus TaxID=68175 RepID=UPI0037CDA154
MASVTQWHASPRREASMISDSGTGEVRVPLSLFHLDQHQGDVDLVLSRAEAAELQELLSVLTAGRPVSVAAAR